MLRAEHSFPNGALKYQFSYSNEPNCDFYTNSMLSFQARIVDRQNTDTPFSLSDYSALGLMTANNTLFVDFSNGAFNGLNTVYITPVITYSADLSLTYLDADAASF